MFKLREKHKDGTYTVGYQDILEELLCDLYNVPKCPKKKLAQLAPHYRVIRWPRKYPCRVSITDDGDRNITVSVISRHIPTEVKNKTKAPTVNSAKVHKFLKLKYTQNERNKS